MKIQTYQTPNKKWSYEIWHNGSLRGQLDLEFQSQQEAQTSAEEFCKKYGISSNC